MKLFDKELKMDGILLVDKPQNFTSFDVVAIIKKLTETKKVGHAGTLDPLATGVLPILIGKATKFQDLFLNKSKEYKAFFKLGIETDTQDITGNIIKETSVPDLKTREIQAVLRDFEGQIEQIPPMYSAIKQNGKRLYSLARQGIEVQREKRLVEIKNIELLNYDKDISEISILVSCSKGTYIRTLVADIGEKLGCVATLSSLLRTRSGSFQLKDCITLDEAKKFHENNSLHKYIIPLEKIFENYKNIILTPAQGKRFRNGGDIDLSRTALKNCKNYKDAEVFKVYVRSENQNFNSLNFLGLGKINLHKNELEFFKLLI